MQKVVNLARKTRKKKKDLGGLVLLIVIVIMVGFLGYLNKDKFFPEKALKTAIIVNGEMINSAELNKHYQIAKKQDTTLTEEDFLDQMVVLTLLLQEADKEGIYVTDKEVDSEISELTISFGSEEEMDRALNEIGVTREILRTQIKKQLAINKLINKTIIANIKVSDSEVKSFYDSNQEFMGNISFDDIKEQIKSTLVNEKTGSILETRIKQLKSNSDIVVGEEIKKTKLKVNKFTSTNDKICKENNKPIIRLFSTTTCSQCNLIRDIFDSTVREFEGDISAYHWELDIGDNTLTPEKETGIPKSEVEIFKKYNSKSTIPTYVFGCKYIRIGNAYEDGYLAGEKEELKYMIEELIE